MWMVDPTIMCHKHLLGEHVELHMLVGAIRRGKSLAGYVAKGLIDTTQIRSRHDALAQEMWARGYNHKSPLVVPPVEAMGRVDSVASVKELARRCELCAARQNGEWNNPYEYVRDGLDGGPDGSRYPDRARNETEMLEKLARLPDTPEKMAAAMRLWEKLEAEAMEQKRHRAELELKRRRGD